MKSIANPTAQRASLILGFLAAAAIGWNAAGFPNQTAVAEETPDNPAVKPAREASRPAGRFVVPSEARARVATLRAIRSPEERMRATIHMANTLPLTEIEGWLEGRWFELSEGYDLSLFNKILKERWQAEDPEGLVRWLVRDSSGDPASVIADWAQREPSRVLEYLTGLPDTSTAIRAFSQLAQTNPALALEGLMQIAASGSLRDGNSQYYTGELMRQLAKTSPGSLLATLDSLPTHLRTSAEAALIGAKLSTSFASGIRELWDRPDGWKIFQEILNHDRSLGANLLSELANLPPQWHGEIANRTHALIDSNNARDWLKADLEGLGFSDEHRKRIIRSAISTIARSAPEEALTLLSKSGFTGEDRLNVISNLFGSLGSNPEKAEALLASLGSDEERTRARSVMEQVSTANTSGIEKPEDWLEKAGTSGPDNFQLLMVLRQWNQDQLSELGTRFRTMPEAEKSKVATLLVSGHVNHLDPVLKGDAIKFLVSQPPPQPAPEPGITRPSQTIRQASQHAAEWVKNDPAAATAWVQSLPAGDEKQWAQKNLAANWALYDPQEANRWLDSLPAETRAEVRKFMEDPH